MITVAWSAGCTGEGRGEGAREKGDEYKSG